VDFAPGLSEEMRLLLFTPETSGGLLAAVSPQKLGLLLDCFAEADHPCWVVGEVTMGKGIEVC
jgi:selenide,water dikinase